MTRLCPHCTFPLTRKGDTLHWCPRCLAFRESLPKESRWTR